ncbi:MAG: efflux RND transporter periplasmic adaptor subunit [Planctomycetes bacterium]|nr:efflux RND transporter periplasmic adaptor subunit [Planctomycetota bacterium]
MLNMSSLKKLRLKTRQSLFSLMIIAFGIFVVIVLVKMRKAPKQVRPEVVLPLVKTMKLQSHDVEMIIEGNGTVIAKIQVEIVPQVAGKIISINPDFVSGGFIPAGTQILQIEPDDYELLVQQAQAGVAEAVVKFETEESEGAVALKEWKQIHGDTKPTSDLVLRKPQIRQAKAKLQSAEATLATAKLNLDRTKISLPVDVVVERETVDLGQFVTVGKTLGSAYGIDAVEIELPLEDRELAWFDVPTVGGDNADKPLTVAQVKADFAGAIHIWKGYITRTTGQVDIKSRFVSVVVEVPEPFKNTENKPALMPGMFVDVTIKGRVLKDAIAIPRMAVHNRNQIWVVNNDRLYIKDIDVVRMDDEFAYVTGTLEDGSVIVISALDVVVDGMRVRLEADEQK